jgi:hypothetical protein
MSVGEPMDRVMSDADSWPWFLFAVENADGSVERAMEFSIASGQKMPIHVIFLFHNDRLEKIVRSAGYVSFVWPADVGTLPIDEAKVRSLARGICDEPSVSPAELKQLAEKQMTPHLMPSATYALWCIPAYTIGLPFLIGSNLDAIGRHDRLDPTHFPLGSSVDDADRRFGSPSRTMRDANGEIVRAYFDNKLTLPVVLYFRDRRCTLVTTATLAVESE